MSDAARPELTPEEVKAQREAKKAEKAARAAASKAKAGGDAADAAPVADTVPAPAAPAPQTASASEPAAAVVKAEPSAEEVKAQREAKKAEKAARAAASKAKAGGDAAEATPAAAVTAAASPLPASSGKSTKHADPAPAAAAAPAPSAPALEAIPVPPNPAKPLRTLAACEASYEFAHLGMLTRTLRLVGSNARTLALLRALKDLAKTDGTIAAIGALNQQSAQEILRIVKRNTDFLASCRTPTAGMSWTLKTFRDRVMRTAGRRDTPAKMRAADVLVRHIDDITQDIQAAVQDCAAEGAHCIQEGDVVMTYGRSSSIEHAFALAAANNVDFTVVVVDSAPLFEGRGLQWRLQQRGIKTSYVLLTSVCAIMPRVTRVFIGAVSILQNGQVVGRAGTAVVSLVTKQFRRPLICFCETFKFSDRIWRGSNANAAEGGALAGGTGVGQRPEGGVSLGVSALAGSRAAEVAAAAAAPTVCLARYDASPKDAVDHVVSEIGFLHPSAIAAAIRDRDEREARTQDSF